MSTLELIKDERSFSFSRLNSYLRCGKAYELSRITRYPEAPAWYLIGGSAVHKATEMIDRGDGRSISAVWEHCFHAEIEEAEQTWPDWSEWRDAGRKTPQAYDFWLERGMQYTSEWCYWRSENPEVEMSGVEVDLTVTLPSGLTVKAFADRVGRWAPNDHRVIDIKTGSTRPESPLQLEIYSTLLMEVWGLPTEVGCYFMAKDGTMVEKRLQPLSIETLDTLGQTLFRGIDNEVYLPHRTAACYSCGVKRACYLTSGDTLDTRAFDPLNPHYGAK